MKGIHSRKGHTVVFFLFSFCFNFFFAKFFARFDGEPGSLSKEPG